MTSWCNGMSVQEIIATWDREERVTQLSIEETVEEE